MADIREIWRRIKTALLAAGGKCLAELARMGQRIIW